MKLHNILRQLRPLDFFILLVILSAGIFFMATPYSVGGDTLVVNANGTELQYSMGQDGVYSVQGSLGETSFEIKDGKVRIIDSPCPNKTCMEQTRTNPIVCLPNKVMLSVQKNKAADKDGGFDAISE